MSKKERTSKRIATPFNLPEEAISMLSTLREETGATTHSMFEWAFRDILSDIATKELTIEEIVADDRATWYGKISEAKPFKVTLDAVTHSILINLPDLPLVVALRRAAMHIIEVRDRYALEQRYQNFGGVGDPRRLSTGFMRLWIRHATGKLNAGDVPRLMMQLQTAVAKLQQLEDQVTSITATVEKYLPAGVAAVCDPPTAYMINRGTWGFLTALARRTGVAVPASDIPQLRRRLLMFYGYRFEGP